jgi:hypothetical protein
VCGVSVRVASWCSFLFAPLQAVSAAVWEALVQRKMVVSVNSKGANWGCWLPVLDTVQCCPQKLATEILVSFERLNVWNKFVSFHIKGLVLLICIHCMGKRGPVDAYFAAHLFNAYPLHTILVVGCDGVA